MALKQSRGAAHVACPTCQFEHTHTELTTAELVMRALRQILVSRG